MQLSEDDLAFVQSKLDKEGFETFQTYSVTNQRDILKTLKGNSKGADSNARKRARNGEVTYIYPDHNEGETVDGDSF